MRVAGPEPDLDSEDVRSQISELLTLRREYGMGAVEALKQIPAWEYDLLVAAATPLPDGEGASAAEGPAGDQGDPWAKAPPAM